MASFELLDTADLQGNPLYFALDVMLEPPSAHLSLMIDNGSGRWQYSNATRGLACRRDLGIACTETQGGQRGPASKRGLDFVTRSYQAVMRANGTARFGLVLTPPGNGGRCTATMAGIAIAPVGARWHSLSPL